MSKLGLGLIAADSAIRSADQQQLRDRATERFDWERQRAQSDLSTLDDRAAATRSQAQLQARQNTASLGLVDKQTDNASKALDIQAGALDGAKARQPDELLAQANKAKVSALLSEFDVEQLPAALNRKRAEGAVTDADIFTTSIAKLADLLNTNDSAAVVRFMNGMNDAGVFGGKRHAPVASVGIENDPQYGQNLFVAKDANGNVIMRMSAESMRRVRAMTGKSELKTVNAGDTLVSVSGGRATPVFTAPESEKSRAAKTGPLERDVDYLVRQHGMTPDQALKHLNAAKSMSRDQFVLKSVQDTIAIGKKPTDADMAEFGRMYDSATSSAPKSQPGASNSAAAGKLDPQIRSLIGLP